MSPVTMKSQNQEEEDLIEEDESAENEAELEEGKARQPAISDSRRRRLRARGIDPDAAPTAVEENAGITAPKGRPTPGRDGSVAHSQNPVFRTIGRFTEGIREYIHDVRSELGRVTWLSRPDLLRLSYIVIGVTVASAIFLGAVSFIFGELAGAVSQSNSPIAAAIIVGLIIIVAGGWLIRDRLFPSIE